MTLFLLFISTSSANTYAMNTVSRGNATGQLRDVKYSSRPNGNNEAVTIIAINHLEYSVFELTNPRRIVLDIFNAAAPGKQQIVQAGGKVITRIRYAQFDTYTARVVIELKSEVEYGVEKTDTGLVLYIGGKLASVNLKENETTPTETTPTETTPTETAPTETTPTETTPTETTPTETTPTETTPTETTPTETTTSSAVKKTLKVHSKFSIQYTPTEVGEDVAILLSNYAKYKVTRLTDPDRLVINIPKAKYTSDKKQAYVNGNQINTINYVKSGTAGATITLSLNAQSQYSISEAKGKLLLSVQKPTYRNIKYHNNGDRVYFTLKDAALTEGDEFLKELYAGAFDATGKKYVVTFLTGQADLGNGVMKINDQYLQSVEVKTNQEEGTTSLTFNGTAKNTYFAYTRNNSGITSITILKPAAQTQKLVVIDPGHGGKATGAIYKNLLEKDLNLDIAKRLNTLLEKKGVKTYMLREDDSDIANYERAYIANKLQAKLYLSIHNNAMDSKNYSGTMTLYCPSKSNIIFTGMSFANIIQQQMLSSLRTVNRKVIGRIDIIVHKATAMPSALAEVGFMTNSTDRSNLQRATFRQKAAQALCDSIVKSLKKVK